MCTLIFFNYTIKTNGKTIKHSIVIIYCDKRNENYIFDCVKILLFLLCE